MPLKTVISDEGYSFELFYSKTICPMSPSVMRLVQWKECEIDGKYHDANILKGRGGNDVQHDKEN